MAAGEGTRLRPLTTRWAKPVLPIDGRPVVATLLRELAEAGCSRAVLVTGHLAAQVELLVGDGSGFGLEVRCTRQPRADGSADAVRRGLAAGASPPAIVTAADTLYRRGDVRRFWEAFAASGADSAIGVRREPPPGPGKPPVGIRAGRVVRVLDDDPANALSSAPLWAIGPQVARELPRLPGPPFELAVAYQRAIDSGVAVAPVEIGRTRDLTRPEDLVQENFGYAWGLTT